jgi:hypothetical protein
MTARVIPFVRPPLDDQRLDIELHFADIEERLYQQRPESPEWVALMEERDRVYALLNPQPGQA